MKKKILLVKVCKYETGYQTAKNEDYEFLTSSYGEIERMLFPSVEEAKEYIERFSKYIQSKFEEVKDISVDPKAMLMLFPKIKEIPECKYMDNLIQFTSLIGKDCFLPTFYIGETSTGKKKIEKLEVLYRTYTVEVKRNYAKDDILYSDEGEAGALALVKKEIESMEQMGYDIVATNYGYYSIGDKYVGDQYFCREVSIEPISYEKEWFVRNELSFINVD